MKSERKPWERKMNNLENDRIQEACWEDFIALYDCSESFSVLVQDVLHPFEAWIDKEYGRYDDSALEKLFYSLWSFDSELLCKDKRVCIEAYILYRDSMKKLNELTEK